MRSDRQPGSPFTSQRYQQLHLQHDALTDSFTGAQSFTAVKDLSQGIPQQRSPKQVPHWDLQHPLKCQSSAIAQAGAERFGELHSGTMEQEPV